MARPVWLAGFLGLLLPASSLAAAPLVVGMSAAFTGPSRGLGIEFHRGASAWFREVNRTGGVHGRPIELRACDDNYNPGPAIHNTRRFILEDDVILLFGYVGTPTVTRVLPQLKLHERRAVFLFCPFTGAETMRFGPYASKVYHLRASYRDETRGLVENFLAIGRKRIALFYQIDAYGRSGWDGVRRALGERGLKPVAEATYRRGAAFSESMEAQVAILRTGHPDAIICVGAYAACAAFIRDARKGGLDVPIANVSFVGSENLLDLLLQERREHNVDYTRHLINSQVVPSYTQTDVAAVRLYREMMEKHHPPVPTELTDRPYTPLTHSYTSFEGFLSARLVVEVLKELGPELDRHRLPRAAASRAGFDIGLGRRVSFARGRHQALDEVYFTTVEKGEFVPLVDWTRWKQ